MLILGFPAGPIQMCACVSASADPHRNQPGLGAVHRSARRGWRSLQKKKKRRGETSEDRRGKMRKDERAGCFYVCAVGVNVCIRVRGSYQVFC